MSEEKQSKVAGTVEGTMGMISEALGSKKFIAMASALGLTWTEVRDQMISNPHVMISVVLATSMVVSTYIFSQALVDAKK